MIYLYPIKYFKTLHITDFEPIILISDWSDNIHLSILDPFAKNTSCLISYCRDFAVQISI